ncbi:Cephalosporin-C deacetylase [Verrucomicrobium sp. GAS474]|uniref:acetylxylan esterase n=1 Tax=Verrucomicrobium sp. GAS474 TaxID=1882831 RepID=UPI00087A601B|nr:acetylxylan esterase [Verrucomicrobium sp. GAS474]SDU29239.1 Cephalosporin-C deacetylase [Verrucomicrobium sp. GAS474]
MIRFSFILLGAAFAWVAAAWAEPAPFSLTIAADRPDAMYHVGETVTFSISVLRGGLPVPEGEVTWSLTKDGVPPVRQGVAAVKEGKATVTGQLDEPGFLQCKAVFAAEGGKAAGIGAAAVDPLLLRPSLPVPDDFDAFWEGKKRELAAVPLNATMTPLPPPQPGIELFDVEAPAVGNMPMRGYYARPAHAAPKSLPAIITLEGAGVYNTRTEPWLLRMAKEGFLSLEVNAHGLPNGKDAAYYVGLEQGDLKDYPFFGRTSRETVYFLNMFLRDLRGVDFLASQPEWNGKVLVANGGSQGGAQAIFVAAEDRRVTYLSASVPAMCDHSGMVVGRVPGWPRLVPVGADGKPDAAVLEAARYFDSVNFASRVRVPACFAVAFIDQVAPPTSGYVAYDALPGKKEMLTSVSSPHKIEASVLEEMRRRILKQKDSQKESVPPGSP